MGPLLDCVLITITFSGVEQQQQRKEFLKMIGSTIIKPLIYKIIKIPTMTVHVIVGRYVYINDIKETQKNATNQNYKIRHGGTNYARNQVERA